MGYADPFWHVPSENTLLKGVEFTLKAIVNAKVVLPDRLVEDGVILMEGDRIQAVGSAKDIPLPADCEKIDAKGQVAGPGL